jgi:hypothetical protein
VTLEKLERGLDGSGPSVGHLFGQTRLISMRRARGNADQPLGRVSRRLVQRSVSAVHQGDSMEDLKEFKDT